MFALALTFEPMDRFQSVLDENCLEISAQSNGAMSDSSRSSYKKLWSKFYLACPRFEPGTLVFVTGLPFELIDRFLVKIG